MSTSRFAPRIRLSVKALPSGRRVSIMPGVRAAMGESSKMASQGGNGSITIYI